MNGTKVTTTALHTRKITRYWLKSPMDIVNVIYEYAVVADDTIFYQSQDKTEICNAIMEL
jgi:hypothetical protein